MKIRFLEMGIEQGQGVSLSEFKDHLLDASGTKSKLGAFDRYFYCKELEGTGDYIAGLIVTIKDHKRFCELQSEDGKLKVVVNTVGLDSSLMDFNFFIANMANGLILYQYYHNSFSALQFGQFLQKQYKNKQILKRTEQKNAETKLTQKIKTQINKRFKEGLSFQLMVRPENLEALVKELDTIKDFEIDFFELKAPETEFTPLSNFIKKERRTFSFVANTKAAIVSNQLTNIIKKFHITEGKLTGKDINGIERIIHIADNPDNFGEYDYDEITIRLNSLDVENFQKNWVIKELRKKASEFTHVFDAEIEQ